MTKIIHLSDLHMCAPGSDVLGLNPARRLESVINEINRHHSDAIACVVTGDLVDSGDVASYSYLKEQLSSVTVPTWLTLGNHDNRLNYRSVFGSSQLDKNGYAQLAIDAGSHVAILLDTLDEQQPGAGRLCKERLQWLSGMMGRWSQKKILLFMHHPPIPVGDEYFRDMSLLNGSELLAIVDRSGNVDHIAFGHLHFIVAGVAAKWSYSSSRGTCHAIAPVLRGKTVTFVRRSPSFSVLLTEEDGITVHHMEPVTANEIVAIEHADPNGGEGIVTIYRDTMGIATP